MIMTLMNAVCCLFEKKEDWNEAKKLMGQMTFLNDLIEYEVDDHPEKIFLKLRKVYLADETFTEENIKGVSEDAAYIYKWVIATDKY
jgi:dynein heavy chain, axonemal